MRFLAAVVLAAALSSCAPRDVATRGGPGREIPFESEGGGVLVPVQVGESRVLRLRLDTGMGFDGLLLYEPLPESAVPGPLYEVRIPGAGSGEPARGLMAESASVRSGAFELSRQRVVWLVDGLMSGFSSDGVMGYSLFGHWVVELDYDRSVIVLHEPGSFVPDSSWTVIPMELRKNNVPWLKLRASISGEEPVELDCYIDLAARDEVVFLVRDDAKVAMPEGLEQFYLGRGLSGDIHGWKGRAALVELGGFRFEDVEVTFAPEKARSKQGGADAVVGNGLLSRLNAVFDYAGGRLYLRKRPRVQE